MGLESNHSVGLLKGAVCFFVFRDHPRVETIFDLSGPRGHSLRAGAVPLCDLREAQLPPRAPAGAADDHRQGPGALQPPVLYLRPVAVFGSRIIRSLRLCCFHFLVGLVVVGCKRGHEVYSWRRSQPSGPLAFELFSWLSVFFHSTH